MDAPFCDTVNLEQMLRIDTVCLRFEMAWQEGRRPRLEDALTEVLAGDRPALLGELLLLEWDYRQKSGEPIDRAGYTQRFANQADTVESAWQRWLGSNTTVDDESGLPSAVLPHAADPSSLPPGTLAGFAPLHKLGEGGMGIVYQGYDPALKRPVALKMIRAGLLSVDRLVRFRTEAEALARLSHPHIVPIFAWQEHAGQPVMVMEYVPGGTLEDRLTAPLAVREAVRLIAVLARAVQAAHEAGVVHRDLKPANVLMAPPIEGDSGTVAGAFPKVTDFGLAQLADTGTGRTVSGLVLGTPAYMAPEQATGRIGEVGPAADTWALGVILYRCLTGVLPFRGDGVLDTLEQVKTDTPAPPRSLRPDVSAELEAVCLCCLAKDPRQRPSPADLAARLERLANGADAAAPAPAAGGSRKRRGARQLIAAGVVVAAALAGLAVWGAFRPGGDGDGRPLPDNGVEADGAVRVVSLRVRFAAVEGENFERLGVLGKDVFAARFKDGVQITVELSAPGHAFLLGYNADGKEQLLWPVNRRMKSDAAVPPPRQEVLTFPPGKDDWLYLDDDPAGGLQAFAVVASRRPLPAFTAWKEQRGAAAWRKRPAGERVWSSDGRGVYPELPGEPGDRASVGKLPGAPPLVELARSLKRGAEVEAVEMLAFPVRARRAGR
jgi:hypothetical protein